MFRPVTRGGVQAWTPSSLTVWAPGKAPAPCTPVAHAVRICPGSCWYLRKRGLSTAQGTRSCRGVPATGRAARERAGTGGTAEQWPARRRTVPLQPGVDDPPLHSRSREPVRPPPRGPRRGPWPPAHQRHLRAVTGGGGTLDPSPQCRVLPQRGPAVPGRCRPPARSELTVPVRGSHGTGEGGGAGREHGETWPLGGLLTSPKEQPVDSRRLSSS